VQASDGESFWKVARWQSANLCLEMRSVNIQDDDVEGNELKFLTTSI
jgi:hypothetical protein